MSGGARICALLQCDNDAGHLVFVTNTDNDTFLLSVCGAHYRQHRQLVRKQRLLRKQRAAEKGVA